MLDVFLFISKASKKEMRLTEKKLRKIVRKYIREYIEEGEQSARQWESEKEMFFNALYNGRAEVDNDMVWTYYPGTQNSNDPRFIYYKAGDYRLTDDHFCAQHSPALDYYELKDIQDYAKRFGVNIEIPDWAFEELKNGEMVLNLSLLNLYS